jgi:MFS family permease
VSERAGADVRAVLQRRCARTARDARPGGYLAGRFGSLPLAVAGLAVVTARLVCCCCRPTTPLLIAAGVASGAGQRTADPGPAARAVEPVRPHRPRSAFALFTVSFSIASRWAALAFAPFIEAIGFESRSRPGSPHWSGGDRRGVRPAHARAPSAATGGGRAEPAV